MYKIFRFLAFFLLFLWNIEASDATHIFGGYITYECTDSLEYDVTCAIYRDCGGVSQGSINLGVRCSTSTQVKFKTLKVLSVENISPTCVADTTLCNKPNTYGSGSGVELITFKGHIDFKDTAYSSFIKCGKVYFEMSPTSMSYQLNTLTTSYPSYYNYALLDLKNAPKNSSPQVLRKPPVYIRCNTPVHSAYPHYQPDNGDSVSYELVAPKSAYNKTLSYISGHSATKPLKYYDPGGLGYVSPYSSPPTGFYFDKQTGWFAFTATNCAEGTTVVIQMKEWRKDSSGQFQVVGIVNQQIAWVTVSTTANSPPRSNIWTRKTRYELSVGDTLAVKIKSLDDSVKMPPPYKAIIDTSRIDLIIPGQPSTMKFTLGSEDSLNQSAEFTFIPDSSDGGKTYRITKLLRDMRCKYSLFSSDYVDIIVHPLDSSAITTSLVGCKSYGVVNTGRPAGNKYKWWVTYQSDTSNTEIKNKNIVRFKSTKNYNSVNRSDTVQFFKDSSYIVWYSVANKAATYILKDTIKVESYHLSPMFSQDDTMICDLKKIRIIPDKLDTSLVLKYHWNTSSNDSFSIVVNDSIPVKDVILKVLDNKLCYHSDTLKVGMYTTPKISSIPDANLCFPTNKIYTGNDYTDTGGLFTTYLWLPINYKSPYYKPVKGGNYSVIATNKCGSDTADFFIREDLAPKLKPIYGDTLCDGDYLTITAIDLNDSGYIPRKFKWSDGITSAKRNIQSSGNWYVTVTNGCKTDIQRFRVDFDRIPRLNSVSFPVRCPNDQDSVDLFDANDKGLMPRYYQWDDGDTSPYRIITVGRDYQFIASTQCGSDTLKFAYRKDSLDLAPLTDDTICSGEYRPYKAIDQKDSGYFPRTYIWSNGRRGIYNAPNYTGKWWVSATTVCGTDTSFFNFYLDRGPKAAPIMSDTVCEGNEPTLVIRDLQNERYYPREFRWSNGTTDSSLVPMKSGLWWAMVNSKCGTDTAHFLIGIDRDPLLTPINNDTSCLTNVPELEARLKNDTTFFTVDYSWSNSKNTKKVKPNYNGLWWVKSENMCGSDSISFFHLSEEPPAIAIPKDTIICAGNSIILKARLANDSVSSIDKVIWSDSSTQYSHSFSSENSWWFRVMGRCGNDTINFNIKVDSVPQLEEVKDVIICDKLDTVEITNLRQRSIYLIHYTWGDSAEGPLRKIDKQGKYRVTATNTCGSDSVSFIAINKIPNVDLGTDTAFDEPFSFILSNRDTVVGDYLWNTNDTTKTLSASKLGMYWLQVSNNCGTSRDTIEIKSLFANTAQTADLKIVPNPNRGIFYLELDKIEKYSLYVSDTKGSLVEYVINREGSRHRIDLGDVAEGIYSVMIITSDQVYVGRLVID